MKTKSNIEEQVKASRKKSREEEIQQHGKLISFKTTIFKSKKKYDRKRNNRFTGEDI